MTTYIVQINETQRALLARALHCLLAPQNADDLMLDHDRAEAQTLHDLFDNLPVEQAIASWIGDDNIVHAFNL